MAKESTGSRLVLRKRQRSHSKLSDALFFYRVIVVVDHHLLLAVCVYYVVIPYTQIRLLGWPDSPWRRFGILELHLLEAQFEFTAGFIVVDATDRHVFVHGCSPMV